MAAHPTAAAAAGSAWRALGRPSSGDQRDLVEAVHRCALARRARAVWSLADPGRAAPPLGCGRDLGSAAWPRPAALCASPPASPGGGSNVAAMIAASSMVFGRPGRGSSSSPASPYARNRSRHLITVGRVEPTAAATELVPAPGCTRQHDPRPLDIPCPNRPRAGPRPQRQAVLLREHQRGRLQRAMHPASRPPDCKAANDAHPLEAIRAAT